MRQVVGIVGYQGSGKTTLTRALVRELTSQGHEAAVIKHSSHHLDLPGKDTAMLRKVAGQVGFISPQESAIFWKKSLSLENIIPYLEADIVLVEGFKKERAYPKIACLRGMPDDADLFDGLLIAAVGPANYAGDGVSLFDRDAVGEIADLVEQKAFKLPNLDCGGCGRETCYDLAREIVAGVGRVEDCVSLRPATKVRIDGELMPMNPFISGIVRGAIVGMLSPLKGFKEGKIEISI
ncbi:MAG: molybdopterin-guanine dinucleotide biosynthesis protein B [Chloroflexota bacterium]|nr:molybdopterin-guanine dinucleotide biosynthesis protein B [Chloroflexota bacterium]